MNESFSQTVSVAFLSVLFAISSFFAMIFPPTNHSMGLSADHGLGWFSGEHLSLEIAASGQYVLHGRTLTEKELMSALRQYENNFDLAITVVPRPDTSVGALMRARELVIESGSYLRGIGIPRNFTYSSSFRDSTARWRAYY